MDRVGILCRKDGIMMHEFSRRSLTRIRGGRVLSLALSFFSSSMEANVRKEVEKDRLIIREAAAAFTAGRAACDLDLEEIFEKTKKTDEAFLKGLTMSSFTIAVHYSDFADIRIQRIWRISKTVYALLGKWPDEASFADAARAAYGAKEFRKIIVEILHLYSLETRMLGDAIRSPFHSAIRFSVEALFLAMEEATEELADSYAGKIYETAGRATADRTR